MAVLEKAKRLSAPVDITRDHFLGNPEAEITLIEYGSYSCKYCHAAHEVIANLRDRFGDRLCYVFRQLPIKDSDTARPAAELAEFSAQTGKSFWKVHNELMTRGPHFSPGEFDEIAQKYGLEPDSPEFAEAREYAIQRVDEDRSSARESGVRATPTFFINGRRYEGAWDENALAEAMLGSLGHRIQSAALDFVRWGPSAGILLAFMSVLALVLSNTTLGPAFLDIWQQKLGFSFGGFDFSLSLFKWINDGLLSIFFLVVGLEIKKEFTVGHLSTRRAAGFPIAAALGGMVLPALLYVLLAPSELFMGWGVPIATDTAFAIALIVFLGDRVPVELRVFLTAAVIVDDIVAILVVAIFYSGELSMYYLGMSAVVVAVLVVLNRWNVYKPLPYAIAGLILWFFVHEAGLHATLAGVIIAILTPTHPPGNLPAMLAQAENVLVDETKHSDDGVMRHGPSAPAMRALDAIFDRIESPADKLLRTLEPWSSYFVLPIFALANAGVVLSSDVFAGHGYLFAAIITGLVVGKPIGIFAFAYAAVKLKIADMPDEYDWRQVLGVGSLAGIGFTMSLFIAGQAFPNPLDFAAAKIAVFMASILAGIFGVLILLPRRKESEEDAPEAVSDDLHSSAA